jgi:hypothetical protein
LLPASAGRMTTAADDVSAGQEPPPDAPGCPRNDFYPNGDRRGADGQKRAGIRLMQRGSFDLDSKARTKNQAPAGATGCAGRAGRLKDSRTSLDNRVGELDNGQVFGLLLW